MKRLFKGKKVDFTPPPKEPRALDDIKKELGEVWFKLGQARYELYVKEQEISNLNHQALSLNNEGAERLELDKKKTTAVKPKEKAE